jgi:hypothetical protein
MKELTTFIGGAGNYMATVFEMDDGGVTCYTVSCVEANGKINSKAFSKVFMSEESATNFAVEYTHKGNTPSLLNE